MAGLKALIAPIPPVAPAISLIRAAATPVDETDGRWTNGFAFTPYSNNQLWVSDRCDFVTDDSPALAVPTGLVVGTSQGGGTLGTVGSPVTMYYRVSAVSANGQSLAGAEANVVVPSQAGSATAKNTLNWTAVPGAAGYNVYGRATGAELKMTVVPVTSPTFIDTGAITPAGALPAGNTSGGPGPYTHPGEVDWYPGIYHAGDWCSAIGYGGHDFQDRAKMQLDVATAKGVEAEFWSGAFAQAQGYPNLYLQKAGLATDLTPTAVPSRNRGFEILEQGLADAGDGSMGFIHCSVGDMPQLQNLRRVGNLLLSPRDTVVVPGVGYPHTGATGPIGNAQATPPAGQDWMFATSNVQYRVDVEQWYPAFDSPDQLMQALNKDTNSFNYRVAKFAAAYWDGTVTLACRVTTDA